MLRLGWLIAAIAGCYDPRETLCETDSCPAPTDGSLDVGKDTSSDDELCVGGNALLAEHCFPMPTEDRLIAARLDTTNSNDCTPVDNICFVVAKTIRINGIRSDVTGDFPLVLVAAEAIEISTTLDVASHQLGGKTGPAASKTSTACASAGGQVNVNNVLVGPGGTGGSNGSAGGAGGSGRNTMATSITASLPARPVLFEGGCRGGDGGSNPNSGGHGGGVVYLYAGQRIAATGATINASGAGGLAIDGNGLVVPGGGGGGSGGLIVLEAPTMSLLSSKIIALGGGGASGSEAMMPAAPGKDPDPATLAVGAGGLQSVPSNGGGAGSSLQGSGGVAGGGVMIGNTAGGGGGGGGAGYIVTIGTITTMTDTTIAPPPQ